MQIKAETLRTLTHAYAKIKHYASFMFSVWFKHGSTGPLTVNLNSFDV